jgi:cell division protein FtsB
MISAYFNKKLLFKLIKNKYFFSVAFLLVWLLFFDTNDFITQYKYKRKLNQLKAEKEFYRQQTDASKESLYELTTDPNTLEKFAREKYLMKKENEDIFIIVRNTNE